MRKLATLLAMGALVLFVGGAATAKTAPKYSGTISRLDTMAKTFSVKQTRNETNFKLAPNATIMSGEKVASIADLKVGEHVSVTYTKEGNDRVASRVEIAAASSKSSMGGKSNSKAPTHSSY